MKCAYKGCHLDGSRSYQLPGEGGTVYACGVHRFLLEDLIMKATCAVSTCDKPTVARGLCATHYGRFNHHGWLEGIERVTPEQADEFHRQWSERAAQRLNAQMARKLEKSKPPAEPEPVPVVAPPEPADDPKALKARIKSLEDEVALLHRSDRDDAEARDAVQRAEPHLPAGSYAQRVRALIGQRAQALKDLGYANAEAKEAVQRAERAETDRDEARENAQQLRKNYADLEARHDKLVAERNLLHDELQAPRRAQQAPVPAPPDAVCAVPYLHSLLCRDDKLADDLIEAIVRDVGHRLRAKEPAALASILTDPMSRIP